MTLIVSCLWRYLIFFYKFNFRFAVLFFLGRNSHKSGIKIDYARHSSSVADEKWNHGDWEHLTHLRNRASRNC